MAVFSVGVMRIGPYGSSCSACKYIDSLGFSKSGVCGFFVLLREFLALIMFLLTSSGFWVQVQSTFSVWGCAYADDVLVDEDEHGVEDLDLRLGLRVR